MQTAKAKTTVTMMLLISLGLSAICVSVLPAVGQKAGPAIEELRAGKNFIATHYCPTDVLKKRYKSF